MISGDIISPTTSIYAADTSVSSVLLLDHGPDNFSLARSKVVSCMSDSKLKLGDVVKLKSGGPVMTVTCLWPFMCSWMAEGRRYQEDFPEEALEVVDLTGDGLRFGSA